MQIEKLFNVLVVGGVLMAGGSFGNQPIASPADLAVSETGSEIVPETAFCPGEQGQFCEVDCSGKVKVKAGFECCWGTSCEAE